MAHGFDVGGLARENVIFRDRLEVVGGEGQIHRVPRLARKINREAREHRVHRLDFAEAPAAVRAAAALGQLRERFDMTAFNFAGGGEFFKFFFHNYKIVILSSRIHHVSIKRGERPKSKTNCGAHSGPAPRERPLHRRPARNRAGRRATFTGGSRALPGNRLWRRPLAGRARLAHRAENRAAANKNPRCKICCASASTKFSGSTGFPTTPPSTKPSNSPSKAASARRPDSSMPFCAAICVKSTRPKKFWPT